MNTWKAMHEYKRLVKEGSADSLKCPDDGIDMAVRIGPGDEPVLHCFRCRKTVIPGLALWKQIGSAIGEEVET